MTDTSLGSWLRREREQRGITIRTIADQTKVAAPLLEGLEAGDLSRWPGGIYRRAFVKAYASALGLDPDDIVRRFEKEHPPADAEPGPIVPAADDSPAAQPVATTAPVAPPARAHGFQPLAISRRSRLLGTAADLTVALILGLGSAAAGSRLLWPVLLIAGYYSIGVLLTGTSPMVALLADPAETRPPAESGSLPDDSQRAGGSRPAERRHQSRRGGSRAARAMRARTRLQ